MKIWNLICFYSIISGLLELTIGLYTFNLALVCFGLFHIICFIIALAIKVSIGDEDE